MPNITEQPTKGYAHCRSALCPGYQQEEVAAIREESAWTYAELSGNDADFLNPFTERSQVRYRFADEGEAPCPVCGQEREVTGDPRPEYQPLSGFDPMGLLNGPKYDPSMVVPPGEDQTPSPELIELRAEMAEMREQMAKFAEKD